MRHDHRPYDRRHDRRHDRRLQRRRPRACTPADFYLAHPSDKVSTINDQLARGRDLLVTPGVYNIGQAIKVKRADTVVLGLGLATLTAQNGAVPMTVADVPGVDIAGLTIDSGGQLAGAAADR